MLIHAVVAGASCHGTGAQYTGTDEYKRGMLKRLMSNEMNNGFSYVEIYVDTDGQHCLHSRISDTKTLFEILEGLQEKSFAILLVSNRCIVGSGMYTCVDHLLIISHENGAGVGFFDRYMAQNRFSNR